MGAPLPGAVITYDDYDESNLGGIILVAAGIFQWTPIHKNFLARYRNPLEILSRRFGEGGTAFTMGLENGASATMTLSSISVISNALRLRRLAW